jgi:hypothetical protein
MSRGKYQSKESQSRTYRGPSAKLRAPRCQRWLEQSSAVDDAISHDEHDDRGVDVKKLP